MSALAQTRAEWLAERSSYIGGTDAAAILGKNKYKTRLEVWCEKTGRVKPEESMDDKLEAWAGLLLEPLVARVYENAENVELAPGYMVRHAEYPFIGGNPDRLVKPFTRGVELKTYGRHTASEWGETGTDQIPMAYYVQAAQYCALMGYEQWDVIGLNRDSMEWGIYTVRHDPTLWQMILRECVDFWRNHVEADVEPAAVGGDIEYLDQRFKVNEGETVTSTTYLDTVVERAMELGSQAYEIKKERDDYIASIKQFMGTAEILVTAHGNVKWSKSKPKIDWQNLATGLLAKVTPDEAEALLSLNTLDDPTEDSRRLTFPRRKKEAAE